MSTKKELLALLKTTEACLDAAWAEACEHNHRCRYDKDYPFDSRDRVDSPNTSSYFVALTARAQWLLSQLPMTPGEKRVVDILAAGGHFHPRTYFDAPRVVPAGRLHHQGHAVRDNTVRRLRLRGIIAD